jgi:hypothetical protein
MRSSPSRPRPSCHDPPFLFNRATGPDLEPLLDRGGRRRSCCARPLDGLAPKSTHHPLPRRRLGGASVMPWVSEPSHSLHPGGGSTRVSPRPTGSSSPPCARPVPSPSRALGVRSIPRSTRPSPRLRPTASSPGPSCARCGGAGGSGMSCSVLLRSSWRRHRSPPTDVHGYNLNGRGSTPSTRSSIRGRPTRLHRLDELPRSVAPSPRGRLRIVRCRLRRRHRWAMCVSAGAPEPPEPADPWR